MADGGEDYAQLIFRSHVVIRVQTQPARPRRSLFREKKGPPCVAVGDILASGVIEPASVDLVLRGGTRVRMRFNDSCPALDYYSGFYVSPGPDAKICAKRDVVRDRAGGECAIDRIRLLLPRE